MPGYWQIKTTDFFKATERADLSFMRCYEGPACRDALKKISSARGVLNLEAQANAASSTLDLVREAKCLCEGFQKNASMTGTGCRFGHQGPLCAQCLDDWVLGSDKKICEPCADAYDGDAYMGFIFLFAGLLLMLMVGGCMRKNALGLYRRVASKVERKLEAAAGEDMATVKKMLAESLDQIRHKVKLLVGLSQVMSQFNVNFTIPWPIDFSEFISKLQLVNLNFFTVPAVGCYAKTNFVRERKKRLTRTIHKSLIHTLRSASSSP